MGQKIRGGLGLAAALTLAALAVPGTAAATRTTPPGWVTAASLQASFQETGIKIGGRKRTVLDVACVGAGYARGAFPFQRYHLFECYITTAVSTLAQYHVSVYTRKHGLYYIYRPVPLP